MRSGITDKIRKRYDRTAKSYEILETMMESGKMSDWRRMIWSQAEGSVLEVGVGTGINMKYYPHDIDVTAIDFSDKMLEKARQRAVLLNCNVKLMHMDVQALDFGDETFDTVITTCVFCSVPDPIKGLQEMKRVLKKDGQIIMLEHVRSKNMIIGKMLDLFNPLVVRMIGANINRNTVENLIKAGLTVEVESNLMMDIVKHLKCRK